MWFYFCRLTNVVLFLQVNKCGSISAGLTNMVLFLHLVNECGSISAGLTNVVLFL